MAEWSFLVPPDVTVTVRASKKPRLLARALGREIARQPNATLLLDLDADPGSSPGLTARGSYKAIAWRCQVEMQQEGRWTLVWRSPLFREYLAFHIAVLPALRRLLLDRNIALVIGAACASGDTATVLAGDTGSGKTAALLATAAAGAQFIGDEYISISAAGEVTPVVRVLALRRRTLAGAPEFARRLTAGQRIELSSAALAARISVGKIDPLVYVSSARLGLTVAPERSTPISTLVWLERGNGPAFPEPISVTEAVDALRQVQQAHDRAYGGIGELLLFQDDSQRWRETLERGLQHIRCLRATAGDAIDSIIGVTLPEAVAKPSP